MKPWNSRDIYDRQPFSPGIAEGHGSGPWTCTGASIEDIFPGDFPAVTSPGFGSIQTHVALGSMEGSIWSGGRCPVVVVPDVWRLHRVKGHSDIFGPRQAIAANPGQDLIDLRGFGLSHCLSHLG